MEIAPPKTQRIIAGLIAVCAAAGLIAGLVQEPITEWSSLELIDSVILAVLVVAGAYYAIRGGLYKSRSDLRRQRILAWVALVAFTGLMIVLITSDTSTWSVIDTFSLATWAVVLVFFVPQLVFLHRAIAQAPPAAHE
jgi:hypothetical protein